MHVFALNGVFASLLFFTSLNSCGQKGTGSLDNSLDETIGQWLHKDDIAVKKGAIPHTLIALKLSLVQPLKSNISFLAMRTTQREF